MSLIRVNGNNPFDGQKDPYITLNTSVSYEDGPQGVIENSYNLNGVLTGCSVNDLMNRRDALVNSFDWKNDTGIIENIEIIGVVKATSAAQIIPSSLSFDASTYIGAVNYSLDLNVFTGFEKSDRDSYDLYNKTHTVSTSIAEDGCVTRNITIGCEPNANLAHCDAITKANEWISGQLGVSKLGEIELKSKYELRSESMDINPMTSALTYNRTESNCSDGPNTADAGNATGIQLAYCINSQTEENGCPAELQKVTTTYNGEVYGTGQTIEALVKKLKEELFTGMSGITDFSAQFNEGGSNLTFNATRLLDGSGNPISIPQDVTVNNYTLQTAINYNTNAGAEKMGSVNGRVYIENPIDRKPLDVNDEFDPTTMIDVAKGVCDGPSQLSQQSVTYDTIKGGISYSYSFSPLNAPDGEVPNLDGISGLASWSASYKPPINKHETVANLNCSDRILNLNYADRGSLSVRAEAVSGSGYNFIEAASGKGQDLINELSRNKEEIQISKEIVDINGEKVTYSFDATFKGVSVVISGSGLAGELY